MPLVKTYFKDSVKVLLTGKPIELIAEVVVKKESDYVMIEIPIPAACSYNSTQQYYWGATYREYFREKTSIFCANLKPGKYTFSIDLLPRYTGTYTLNPAKAELMYFPVFYGRNEMTRVKVK